MSKYVTEVNNSAEELKEKWKLSDYEALQIAVQIERNKVFSQAFLIDTPGPSALEAIAMELGAARDNSSIKDALYQIASAKQEL